jgi:hypothetical protein
MFKDVGFKTTVYNLSAFEAVRRILSKQGRLKNGALQRLLRLTSLSDLRQQLFFSGFLTLCLVMTQAGWLEH